MSGVSLRKLLSFRSLKQFPKEIILEVTNFCNLRCRFCHFHGEGVIPRRKKGFVLEGVWRKVLRELKNISPPHPITLCLYGGGEPLLYPGLREILKEAVLIPHVRVGFMTNAMLLDEEWARFLVDLPIAWIAFSVDGVKPETNDAVRRGANLETIERNIFRFLEHRAKTSPHLEVSFNMVAYPFVEEDEIKSYVRKWAPYATSIIISRFRPVPSKRLLQKEEREKLRRHACPLPFRQMVIGWDGRVGLCCEDIFLELPLGHVLEKNLLTIFNDSPFKRVRRLHQKKRAEEILLCRECDVWAAEDVLQEDEISLNGIKFLLQQRPSGRVYRRL